jgi:hypothetical protein
MERIKNEHIKEIRGVKRKLDIIEKKRLQWYGHVKRMSEERIPKLIMEWIPEERRKRKRQRKTWMEGLQAAMTARNLEQDQWRNREEWRLVSGRCYKTRYIIIIIIIIIVITGPSDSEV